MASISNPLTSAMQTYSPALKGATDDPVVTYSVQLGRYATIGKLCYVSIVLVSTSMTKTTLTDALRVSLPLAAANNAGVMQQLSARLENATAALNATVAETVANASYVQLRNLPLAAASALLTYGVLSLGVLTNTITVVISGWYEVA